MPGDFLVAIEIDDPSDVSVPLVRIGVPIEPDWLLDFFPDRVEAAEELSWNRELERVEALQVLRYDELVIEESQSPPADDAAAAGILAARVMEAGVDRFVESDELKRFLNRIQFAAQNSGEIVIPADLVYSAVQDLCTGLTSFAGFRDAVKNGGFFAMLESKLPMRLIDEIALTHIKLPNGRRARVEYHAGRPPSVASRLQDFFGMKESPAVAGGSVRLVVQLLAPNHRPVQVTTDLVSFWKNLYPQVRRELSRRYPKHAWPEVPA